MFYEAQVSGPVASWNRVPWRGPSGLQDGADNNLNLTGGWEDAGDHVKFGLPMAYTATLLAWSVVEYRDAFVQSGQLEHITNNLRFVGDGEADHNFWGASEVYPNVRPSYAVTAACPGSEVTGETAAALAAASILFRPTDPSYADTLVKYAIQLYTFADTHRGAYDSCIPGVDSYYKSVSGYQDEIVWGAIWLYLATNQTTYLTKATTEYQHLANQQQMDVKAYTWTHSWDDKSKGCYLLMAKITGNATYKADIQRNLDWWTVGYNNQKVSYSPGGQAWLDQWGSLRYSATAAWLALVYADYIGKSDPLYSRYHDFAVGQINYILGSNPRKLSYMVGFGSNYPQYPHHRNAHGAWDNLGPANSNPASTRHILYGALVGGPTAADDSFTDSRSSYQTTEPANDYVAGLLAASARLYKEYGGDPVAEPVYQKPVDVPELSTNATIIQSDAHSTTIAAYLINRSAFPAKSYNNLSIRYFFTLDDSTPLQNLTLQSFYSDCGSNIAKGIYQWSGNVYYALVDCSGTSIYPGGQGMFKKQVQFRVTSTGAWDATNDWSGKGMGSGNQGFVETRGLVMWIDFDDFHH
ncbi:hypothetical protein HDV00_007931 [Rhizophlyctis rosea]|nr:hypothetical protein HDV00_007931 [Rhizophlyctis rosea]